MDDLRSRVEAILPHVRTPAQYTGGEVNSVRKAPGGVEASFCLAFPDTYAIGMSHIGTRILYHVINSRSEFAAERAFAPWTDMAARMSEGGVPLWSLESFRPVREFDVVGFSLQYELGFTNCLMMLELAGVPVLARDRTDADPLVVAGGPAAYNPEPLADFLDAVVLGDGEEVVLELAEFVKATRGMPRSERLRELARGVEGVYVPSLYEVTYRDDGTVGSVVPAAAGLPERVPRRVVRDLDAAPYPTDPVVPFVETVHERYAVEIMRGCVSSCRFCQAGVGYRPRRERSVETVLALAREGISRTGYDEVGLVSLSSGDYSKFGELVSRLAEEMNPKGVSLSLPSLRVDAMLKDVPPAVAGVRRSGLTMAPECASDRLRRAIAKNVRNEDLFAAARSAYEAGWDKVKLYFMIGLPGETDGDAEGIVEMAREVSLLRKRAARGGPARVSVSVATFVPKAHTPFQWEPMASREDVLRRQEIVRSRLAKGRVRASFHDIEASRLEAVLARGDRRLGRALVEARARGCSFDAWAEGRRDGAWSEAFRAAGLDPDFYALRARDPGETLPWSHIDGGATEEQLARERERAAAELAT